MGPIAEIPVTWRSGICKGETDHFAGDLFAALGTRRHQKHRVTAPWMPVQDWAWFDIAVENKQAVLDYRPYRTLNKRHGMDLGELRVTFSDAERTKIRRYEWRGHRERLFKTITFDHLVSRPARIGNYRPRKGRGRAKPQSIKERPGQSAFKSLLLRAYAGRCCITGCDVREALDAAHIDPYENKSHDHLSNGLLLRKDLHALFDSNLLAIHPGSGRVHLAEECLDYAPYRRLNASGTISKPVVEFAECRPDPAALRRRWQAFASAQRMST